MVLIGLIGIIGLIGLMGKAHAQITHSSQGNLDENAIAALKKAADYLESVKGTVTLTMLDSQKKQTSKQSAKVTYLNGKYCLVMDNMEVWCDGKTVWQWNKTANEVVINNMPTDDEIDLLNPARLIANCHKNFRVKYIRTEDDGTAVVDLQPRSSQSYHKIRLFVNEETGALRRLEVHKYDSSREIYDFSKMKHVLLRGSFAFDVSKHPEAEIIDMR